MSEEEVIADMTAKVERVQNGMKEYERVLEFAKSNNVKGVRKGMKKDTLLRKITEAGLTYTA